MSPATDPRVDQERLKPLLQAYVQRSIADLATLCPEGESIRLRGIRDWQRRDDQPGVFELRDREEPYWVPCMYLGSESRHAGPEYEVLADAIRADPLLGQQIDVLVGSDNGAQRQDLDHVADSLIWAVARRQSRIAFDQKTFDEEFDRFVQQQERDTVDSWLVAPLLGFHSETLPIGLGDLVIDHLTDDEIARCLLAGVIPVGFGRSDYVRVPELVGIRVYLPRPKRIGDDFSTMTGEEAHRDHNVAADQIEAVVEALRSFKAGHFAPGGLILLGGAFATDSITTVGGFRAWSSAPVWTAPFQATYSLTDEDRRELLTYWQRFVEARGRSLIDAAIRRFSYAADRHRADDRLVDLVIAAETLFLGDAGNPQERGELRFRYALRAAFFIEVEGATRRDVFRFMRNGYDARSAIVHGGSPDEKLLTSIDGRQLTLVGFADATESILRTAFRKAIENPDPAGGALTDWDALIIGQ